MHPIYNAFNTYMANIMLNKFTYRILRVLCVMSFSIPTDGSPLEYLIGPNAYERQGILKIQIYETSFFTTLRQFFYASRATFSTASVKMSIALFISSSLMTKAGMNLIVSKQEVVRTNKSFSRQ